jgi:hypothetical protein
MGKTDYIIDFFNNLKDILSTHVTDDGKIPGIIQEEVEKSFSQLDDTKKEKINDLCVHSLNLDSSPDRQDFLEQFNEILNS